MRVSLGAQVLVVALSAAALAQSPGPSALDRDAFTFLEWNLAVRIESQAEALSVRGKILLRNDSPQAQKQVPLQISSSLKWAAIRAGGNPVPFSASLLRSDLDHTGNVDEAVVDLPSAVAPGAVIELEVGYSGTVSLDTTRLAQLGAPLEVRAGTDYDRITPTFTCLRGVGHVLWFPASLPPAVMGEGNRVFEESSAWAVRHSRSTMKISLADIGDSGSILGNAQTQGLEAQGGAASSRLLAWNHLGLAGPILVAGRYQTLEALKEPSSFKVLFFSEHQAQAEDYARVLRDTLPTITGRSQVPVLLAELPEAEDTTFDGDTLLLTPLKPVDRKSFEVTIAYMRAHQTLWSPRAWIYQGAAHLAQALMRERQDGRAAAIAYMQQRLTPLILVDSAPSQAARERSLINTTSEVFYRTKAMYVWWMLREIVGQRALLDSLEQYDPALDKEPSYMQKLLEKNSKKDLEWFFDDWVYQDRGLPELKISNGYARPSLQGLFVVSATIENLGGASAEVSLIVHTDQGDLPSRIRVPGHGRIVARVEVGSRPLEITINDGSVPEAERSDHKTAVRIGQG